MVKILNEKKHEEQRLRLLAQARRLFASRGFKETSMAEVAKACKVTKAGLYHYFKSKDEILTAILAERREEMVDLRKRLAGTGSLEECLAEFARIHLGQMADPAHLDLVKIILSEAPKSRIMKHIYTDFCSKNITECARDVVKRFAPALPELKARLAFYQFLGALLHYSFMTRMVGAGPELFGEEGIFLRRLVRVHADAIRAGV